jgi:hypothetical protein
MTPNPIVHIMPSIESADPDLQPHEPARVHVEPKLPVSPAPTAEQIQAMINTPECQALIAALADVVRHLAQPVR